MNINEFLNEMNMPDKALSVILTDEVWDSAETVFKGCTLKALNVALDGKPIQISNDNISCKGAASGCGFFDGTPDIKGGFGNFISKGAGEGFPPGERIKATPELAIAMINSQSKNVLNGKKYIVVKIYEETDIPTTVTFLVNCDQLSALIHLFNYRKGAADRVYAAMSSGCASIFRIPFGEAQSSDPRAVIGSVDVFSRPHFDKDKFFLTVSYKDFLNMLADADESIFKSHIWKGIKNRL